MIKEELKNIKSGKRDLRKFGLTIGIVLALFGGFFVYKKNDIYAYFFVSAAVLILLSFAVPNLLKTFQKIWMSLAIVLGWFMSRVLLSVLFYAVLTPIGFIPRIFAKHFLDLNFDKSKESYWLLRPSSETDVDNYERQF